MTAQGIMVDRRELASDTLNGSGLLVGATMWSRLNQFSECNRQLFPHHLDTKL